MKARVYNPRFSPPTLGLRLSTSETRRLATALAQIREHPLIDELGDDDAAMLDELARLLSEALSTERPHGLKGANR